MTGQFDSGVDLVPVEMFVLDQPCRLEAAHHIIAVSYRRIQLVKRLADRRRRRSAYRS